MNLEDMMKEAVASLERALVDLTWTKEVGPAALTHYTGRGNHGAGDWRVELIVLGSERMATAVRGSVILKLTAEQAQRAEALALGER